MFEKVRSYVKLLTLKNQTDERRIVNIILVGLSHETTPVELREKLAFQPNGLGQALSELTKSNDIAESKVREAVILSTCNRVEIYAAVDEVEAGFEALTQFLSDYHGLVAERLSNYLYRHANLRAVEHLFSVTSGLNSMVLGENQIQCQVKQAFEIAQKFRSSGPILSTLFRNALTVGKRVRSETTICEHSLSISHAAVEVVRREFSDFSSTSVVVIGVGKMSQIAIKNLLKQGIQDLVIINRSLENSKSVAEELNVQHCGFDQLEACLQKADVVISSTSAPHIILTYDKVKKILASRKKSKLLIVDIAVPRDVEATVDELENVTLFNIDALQDRVESNLVQRCNAISQVKEIINQEMENFIAWRQSLNVKPVISDLCQQAEFIRQQELERALRRFENNLSIHDSALVQDLTRRIINKLLHQPLVKLRKEAVQGNSQFYTTAVRNLFGLQDVSKVDINP